MGRILLQRVLEHGQKGFGVRISYVDMCEKFSSLLPEKVRTNLAVENRLSFAKKVAGGQWTLDPDKMDYYKCHIIRIIQQNLRIPQQEYSLGKRYIFIQRRSWLKLLSM